VLSILHRIIKEDEISGILSLHQVEYATRYADRIIGLAHGCVVFDGAPRSLTSDVLQQIYGEPRRKSALVAA
jgi:phosphonate transport system ATP-binding protein